MLQQGQERGPMPCQAIMVPLDNSEVGFAARPGLDS